MSKDDAIRIMNNSNLNEKNGLLQFLLLYLKMSEETYYQIRIQKIQRII